MGQPKRWVRKWDMQTVMDDILGINLGRRASQSAEKASRKKVQTKTARIKARKSYLTKALNAAFDEFTVVDLKQLYLDVHKVRHGSLGSPGAVARFNAVFAEIIEHDGARHAVRLIMAAFTLQETPDGVAWFQNPKNFNPLAKNLQISMDTFKVEGGLGAKYTARIEEHARQYGIEVTD